MRVVSAYIVPPAMTRLSAAVVSEVEQWKIVRSRKCMLSHPSFM